MKLFNKTIDRQLFKQYSLGSDLSKQEVVVKIFNPYSQGTWFILNSDPEDPDYLWAIVDLGYGAEVGSVSRSELENYRGRFGLGFERDLSFDPINASELFRGLRQGKFYGDGGQVEEESLMEEIRSLNSRIKSLSEINTKEASEQVKELVNRRGALQARLLHIEDSYADGGFMSDVYAKGGATKNFEYVPYAFVYRELDDPDFLPERYSPEEVEDFISDFNNDYGTDYKNWEDFNKGEEYRVFQAIMIKQRKFADGGKVSVKYGTTKKPDENGFYYIVYSESGKKVPSSKLPTNIGYGKTKNEFVAKRKKYDNTLGLQDAIFISMQMNSQENGENYADGGDIESFTDNQQMIMNQNVELEHHHEELEDILKDEMPVPAWVVAKMATATQSVSDITHYLDGEKELMEDKNQVNSSTFFPVEDEEEDEDEDEVMDREVVEPIYVNAGSKTELTKNFTDNAWGNLRGFLKGMEGIDLRDDYTFDYKDEQFEVEPIINTDDKGVSNAVFTIFDGDGEEVGEVMYSRDGGKQKFTANSEFFSWNNAKFEDGGFMNGVYADGGEISLWKAEPKNKPEKFKTFKSLQAYKAYMTKNAKFFRDEHSKNGTGFFGFEADATQKEVESSIENLYDSNNQYADGGGVEESKFKIKFDKDDKNMGEIITPYKYKIIGYSDLFQLKVRFRELYKGTYSFNEYNICQFIIESRDINSAIKLAIERLKYIFKDGVAIKNSDKIFVVSGIQFDEKNTKKPFTPSFMENTHSMNQFTENSFKTKKGDLLKYDRDGDGYGFWYLVNKDGKRISNRLKGSIFVGYISDGVIFEKNDKYENGGYFDGTIPNVSTYMSTYANGGEIEYEIEYKDSDGEEFTESFKSLEEANAEISKLQKAGFKITDKMKHKVVDGYGTFIGRFEKGGEMDLTNKEVYDEVKLKVGNSVWEQNALNILRNESIKNPDSKFKPTGDSDKLTKYLSKRDSYANGGIGKAEILGLKKNIMGTTNIEMKITGMRKPQSFIVYPISANDTDKIITIQSSTRIGQLDLKTGRGLMSQSHQNGAYGVHLQMDKLIPFTVSGSDLEDLKSHIFRTAGSNVGTRGIVSDNSGASGVYAKGGTTDRVPVSAKLSKAEISNFVSYVHSVYEEQGFTERQVKIAVNKYLTNLGKQYTYGWGDSLDRERVYQYLLDPKLNEIKNPRFSDGGFMNNVYADGGDLIKTPYGHGEFLWFFNWEQGGYNQVYAETKAQAIKKATQNGYPTYMPDNEYARKRSLQDVKDQFGQQAVDYIRSQSTWSNEDQKYYSNKDLKLTDVGFSVGLVPIESSFRKQTYDDSRETTRMGNMMTMADGGGLDMKYYVIDVKDGKVVSKGFDTEEEAKVEKFEIFEKTNNFFLSQKKMSKNEADELSEQQYTDGGGTGFIPMDLEEKLRITAKWGGTDIKGVIGVLNAMVDSGLTDEDLKPRPTKSGTAHQNAIEKKANEIWAKIEPQYKGDLKGNMPYGTIRRLVDRANSSDDILKRFKPFRKLQKDSYADGGFMSDVYAKGGNMKHFWSWKYAPNDDTYKSVIIYKTDVDDENSYDSVEQIKEQLMEEGVTKFTQEDHKYAKGGTLKKYILKADIETVTLKRGGKEVTYKGADVLNGANVLAKGGDISSKANYVPKRDVVEVELKDGSKVKPVNGYWVKKGAEPIGAEPTPTSSASAEPKISTTQIRKDMRGNWKAETNIDNFNGYNWRLSTVKTYSGDLVSSAQGGKSIPTQTKGVSLFSYTMYEDPNHTLEVSKPKRLTDKVVAEQHQKALAKFKKFMETGMFKGGGKISNFDKLSAKVAKDYEGKPVQSKYQEEYGKYYSKEEAQEVGDKVAGKVKAMQSDKKAFGGFFGGAKSLITPSKKYPDLKGEEVRLKTGKLVQVFTQNGDNLTVLEIGKFGTGETPHAIKFDDIDTDSFKMGGVTKTSKNKAGSSILIQANDLAKKIRKSGESWQDAKKRAFAELKK